MKRQAGMTLMEVMIALAIMSVMLVLAWKTISNTSDGRRSYVEYEERNNELRIAMGRMVADFESAYLSLDEGCPRGNQCPPYVTDHPRTIFQARATGKVPKMRFSTLGHRILWADAHESEQTVIEYLAHNNPDPDHASEVDLIRREQRRPSNEPPDQEPSDYDVLVHDISSLKLEFWNWRTLEWVEQWDTTQSDGNRGWLPSRVRITLTIKGPDNKDIKLVTQARVYMQEPLNFSPT